MQSRIIKTIFSPPLFAIIVVFVFGLVGIISYVSIRPLTDDSLPLFLFYIILLINTYFSVKFFTELIPDSSLFQRFIDTILVLAYVNVAFSMGSIVLFEFALVLLFIVASAKYTFLLGEIPHNKLLRKKILIDLLGAGFAALSLGGALFWDAHLSAWVFTILFALANIFFLAIKPMYRL
jgi:hypothetical protein